MADTPSNAPKPAEGAKTIQPADASADPTLRGAGEVTHLEDGSGTRQLEPRAEDLPHSMKVTPAEVQANPRMARAVGDLVREPGTDNGSVAAAIQAGSDAQVAHVEDNYGKVADLYRQRAEIDAKIGELSATGHERT